MTNDSFDENSHVLLSKHVNYTWPNFSYDFPVETTNYSEMNKIKNHWLHRLRVFREYYPETSCFSKDDVLSFVKHLIDIQRNKETDSNVSVSTDGSWCMPIKTDGMPSDARVDLMYFPTYIATAFLCLAQFKIPSISRNLPGFNKAVRKGLRFSSGRKLSGHGYDSTIELLDAVEILSLGNIFEYVKSHPKVYLSFNKAVSSAQEQILEKLADNTGWGSIDEDKALLCLKYLDGHDNTNTFGEL